MESARQGIFTRSHAPSSTSPPFRNGGDGRLLFYYTDGKRTHMAGLVLNYSEHILKDYVNGIYLSKM